MFKLVLHTVELKRNGLEIDIQVYNSLGFTTKNTKFNMKIEDLTPPPLY